MDKVERDETASIQAAIFSIHKESQILLDEIISSKKLNHDQLSNFSLNLKSFVNQVDESFPKLSSMRDSFLSTARESVSSGLSLNYAKTEDKIVQLDGTNLYSPKFDKNESLARLLCQAFKHFSDDMNNF
jgi:hypothetical protein